MNTVETPRGALELRTKICVLLGSLYAFSLGLMWLLIGGFLLLWPYAVVLSEYSKGDASSDTWGKRAIVLGLLVPLVFLYFSPVYFLFSLPVAVTSVVIMLNGRKTVPLLGILDFRVDADGVGGRGSIRTVIDGCFELFENNDNEALVQKKGAALIAPELLKRFSAIGSSPDSRGSLYEVSISAKSLTWPSECSCCLSPSNTARTISHSHEKGVEVIRTTTRTWDVPYCSTCTNHVDAMTNALAEMNSLYEKVGSCRSRLYSAGIVAGVLIMLHGAAGLSWAQGEVAWTQGEGPQIGVLPVVIFVVVGQIAPLLMCLRAFRRWESCVQDFPPAVELYVAALDECKERCSGTRESVEYAGWHDTWSDLRFSSKGYLSRFLSTNAKKRRSKVKTIKGDDFGDDQAAENVQYGGGDHD